MPTVNASDARMEALRRRFQDRARADGAALLIALQAEDRQRLLYLAHGLAGVAGIFGHAEISAQAAAVEAGLEAGLDEAALTHLVHRLVAALDEVGQPGG